VLCALNWLQEEFRSQARELSQQLQDRERRIGELSSASASLAAEAEMAKKRELEEESRLREKVPALTLK
jgi:hypothetical protein